MRSRTRPVTPRRPPARPIPVLPPASVTARDGLASALVDLQELAERLRRDCPWDREQTARTIVPHTVEEAYEVADAAVAGDDAKLLDELGDLLFQVFFLSLLLEERGVGDLAAVAEGIHEKLVRRHPHVFGEAQVDSAGAVEELRATPSGDELGDVLFACVNVARHLGVDPELELREASRRFVGRVERAAELAAEEGQEFTGLPLEEQDRWFDAAKEGERSAG